MQPRWPLDDRTPHIPLWLAVPAVALALAVAGCGHSGGTTAAPGSSTRTCGTTRTAANVPVTVEVKQGHVACTAAMTVERGYAKAIASGQEPGNGGGGPVMVQGWRCVGFPTPRVLKTGDASECTRAATEILAILPPPSSSS
jgi:hypothetical protein